MEEEQHESLGREGVWCEGCGEERVLCVGPGGKGVLWEGCGEEGVWYVGPGEKGVLCEGCGEEGDSQCRLHFLLHTGLTCTSVDPACGRRERERGGLKGK